MFEALHELLERRSQRFICRDGWPKPCPPEHTVAIQHEVGPPLRTDELNLVRQKRDIPDDLAEFYKCFGFVRLFSQVDADESAYYIAHPDEWDELNDSFTDWIEDLTEEEKEEFLPTWISNYIVFGEIPASGNYYLMPITGDQSGAIFEFEHDGLEFIKRGNSISEFVSKLSTVTDQLLEEISGHTRYRDDRPDSQWMVAEYEYAS